ncbi:TadE/TadG family type IV pilus assembly protein [Arthrobacter crystallopoietes]|uniref:TadE/TadG family type IV pilus assembly protein n=1 Tax=Crystallibacter crystallopoietes TaxID=37928 RepID=UPI000943BDFA|nr:TadE family protein [Arthrobacter crystallopoietes]AUI49655.1 hypothetical protein AC20117_01335 [Arthrobacter crystallopoietes]
MRRQSERGAVAIEFAIVLPVLLILLIGMIEFGRIFSAQIILTNAAREGARTMAITDDLNRAESAVLTTAAGLVPSLLDSDISVSADCASLDPAFPTAKFSSVVISYSVPPLTGIVGPIDVGARGVSRCEK